MTMSREKFNAKNVENKQGKTLEFIESSKCHQYYGLPSFFRLKKPEMVNSMKKYSQNYNINENIERFLAREQKGEW